MFKIGDWVTTEYCGGVGKIMDQSYMESLLRVQWIEEPKHDWAVSQGRIIPLSLAKTKLWKLLYDV